MSTFSDFVTKHTHLTDAQLNWLELLIVDWRLLADLALGDIVLWVPANEGGYIAVAHSRPAGSVTLFYRDILGSYMRDDWREIADRAMQTGKPAHSDSPVWYEENAMRLTAYSVSMREDGQAGSVETSRNTDTGVIQSLGAPTSPFAVMTVHTASSDLQGSTRIGQAFREVAEDLCQMIQQGLFPEQGAVISHDRGALRAADGLVRINPKGIVTFASPNSQSIFLLLGYRGELEGENFSDVVADLVKGQFDTNESLPLIAQGRVARRADIEVNGRVVTLRSIPVIREDERIGGIVLTREVTAQRQQEQELLTKDATIREIHHRVKNNLQTVASLLRVQARRARSDEAKEVLGQAMRRVAAIAVVHDTLSTGLSQIVDFDVVFDRVLGLAAEVASLHGTTVHPRKHGKFGELPSEYATPLALVLTEIVTNAVEHGLAGREGEVIITANRGDTQLAVEVVDTGTGLPGGTVGDGLGTQIVRTLVEGELGGSIVWGPHELGGTQVSIVVPLRWIKTH